MNLVKKLCSVHCSVTCHSCFSCGLRLVDTIEFPNKALALVRFQKKKRHFLGIFPKRGGGYLEGLSLPFTTHPIKLKVDLLWPLLLEFSNIQII